MSREDDRQLVKRARAGEMAALDELVWEHQGSLCGYSYRMCRNTAEAEEMTQESLVKALLTLAGDFLQNPAPYLSKQPPR